MAQPGGLSKEKYLQLMEHLGKEPDEAKMPIGFEDLSMDGQITVNIYSKLGNRVYGDVGFVGKDYTNLPILIKAYNIIDTNYLIDLLNVIDSENIDKSQKSIKKAMDDMKKTKP